ncbi:MAG TPA: hypothetical protein HPQ00_13340 [Magnetococcales bacterium]|nr:hypothetical protein [Magnetococcales bacterium]
MMGGPGGMMGGPAGPNNPAARQQAAGAMERPHGKMHGGHGSMMNHSQGMAPGSMEGQRKGMCCSQGMNGDSRDFTRLTTDTEAVERFLYDQRQRINITSAQEKAWNNFSQSVMNQITTRINVTNIMRKAATENPMDRVEQHLTAMEALMKQRRALFEDFRTLHEQLSNTQKPMAEQLYSNTSD